MTKREAAVKVAKLERLARGTSNPHEAAAAREQAWKLCREHGLGPADLTDGKLGAAFDALLDEIGRAAAAKPPAQGGLVEPLPIIHDVLSAIKEIRDVDKAARLRQFVTMVRLADLVAGDHPTVANVKKTLDLILKNHEINL